MTRPAASLALAGLLLTTATGGAQVPEVAVVEGEFVGGAGPETKEVARQRYTTVVEALRSAGIPVRETSDSTVEHWGLPDVPVAILPYNRAISDDELRHLRAFLDRPAHLIAFYTTRPELATDLGADLGAFLHEQFPEQYSAIRLTDRRPLGLPESMVLGGEVVRDLRPAEGGLMIGRWMTGLNRAAGDDAIILSDRGAVIGCPPSPERQGELTNLLRGLVGHFVPGLWTALAPRAPRRIGPVGHYASLAEFAAALRKAQGQHLAGSKADVREAQELLAGIPRRLLEGHQEGAIAASRRARQLAQRAWWRSYPSRSPEIRAVWASPTVDGGWQDAIRRLDEAHFNMVFPYMASGAAAWYPSRILPRAHHSAGDPLAEAIRWGREHGVEVHPRILGLFTMGASPEHKEQLKQQGRIALSPSGPDTQWLCPSDHQNRLQIIQTAVEMVSTWGAEGVQLDYLRYSWKDRCVCKTCRERFQADTGVTVKSWPEDVLSGTLRERFQQWRREQITSLLRTIRQKVKQADPDATVSAAVFINWESHRHTFGQDWKGWIDEGLVDFVCPMTYTADMEEFQGWVRKQEAWAGGKAPVVMGIGPFADIEPKIAPQGVLDQVQAARRLGCEGFALFNYQEALAERYLPLMALGATSTPAEIPAGARRRGGER
ncbi:MAG: family 10 glycosylhydrolase [Armatimonadota bacterium]|nr:family 10 glycosylhydrolase [Armatimonadota bacterium]